MQISRFTPSVLSHQALESIFVQRHELANDLVERIHESAVTPTKHHTLLIGSRGIGKTHLVSLVYHRITKNLELQACLRIAWLPEELWIGSFLDLLLQILQTLYKSYPDKNLEEQTEALSTLESKEAEQAASQILRQWIGDRTLLLIIENLEDIFSGLGEIGQKKLRAFLQNECFCTILATSQGLFDGVKLRKIPFFGFFRVCELKQLTLQDSVNLLIKLAEHRGDTDLVQFIRSPKGKARIHAVHDLVGGNPRLYVFFSEFLNRESLDDLVEPFMRLLDDLTPYYQERMRSISPQQRKIIQFICDQHPNKYPIPVKEIAKRCFLTHQTTSSQLKDLKEKGYVKADVRGRESFYELQEPLMRICLGVKKERGEVLSPIVDFLRAWYSKEELQVMYGQQMESLKSTIQPESKDLTQYLILALQEKESPKKNPRLDFYIHEFFTHFQKNQFHSALEYIQKYVAMSDSAYGNFLQACALSRLGRYKEAIELYDKALESQSINPAAIWFNRGLALCDLERYAEAVESCDKAIEHERNSPRVWHVRGIALTRLKRYEEAVLSYENAVEYEPNSIEAWFEKGSILDILGRYEEAIVSYNKVLDLNPHDFDALYNLNLSLSNLGRYEEAVQSCQEALKEAPNDPLAWNALGVALGNLGRYGEALISLDKALEFNSNDHLTWDARGVVLASLGQYKEAIESYDRALEVQPNSPNALYNKGVILGALGQYEEALTVYDNVQKIVPVMYSAWNNKGVILRNLGRYEEAMASFDKVLELKPDEYSAWHNRGNLLSYLGLYEEAISSFCKALEYNPNDIYAEVSCAELLLVLNRWTEGSEAMIEILRRLQESNESYPTNAEWILNGLLTQDPLQWPFRIETLLQWFEPYPEVLSKGLVSACKKMLSPLISETAAILWRDTWTQAVGNRPEFQIPLRLLNTALHYKQRPDDPRVLLELAEEERKILKQALGLEE
jgi:tetratricopeptide (TPR) repeat protein